MASMGFEAPLPHAALSPETERDRFAADLFDRLWVGYRQRVPYVQAYERVIHEHGATFVNDHIAFRSIAVERPMAGMASVSRIFEALGYRPAGCYTFEDKHLTAVHFQHPHPQFPKLFISELKTWELEPAARTAIRRTLESHAPALPDETLDALCSVEELSLDDRESLLEAVVDWFERLPWIVPEKQDVLTVNEQSQYAAWVLVHGYAVNHFTTLINSHGSESLNDIEKTVAALKAAGVPMKETIEGAPGSKLRQTATAAAVIDVPVRDGGVETTMPWTYAYFELAERGQVTDPETGRRVRFEGFLGPQATQLFEMTRKEASAG